MDFQRLRLSGFKSFIDPAEFRIEPGLTGVVGPNGCGKSNLVEALRWVMGENRVKQMRGGEMTDVIFNGTDTKLALGFAEVSVTFDNTCRTLAAVNTDEVVITRRLFRSGESEYLINKTPVRLKDITDLFLDTGIGSDSYAIIELKMVDEILNDKNNAIKNLFEEAAGISKYKMRRKQTLQKLEDTDADLSRVNDLLYEIERNMKTLESQAKKTERYYKLKEAYKELSTELAVFTIAGSKLPVRMRLAPKTPPRTNVETRPRLPW